MKEITLKEKHIAALEEKDYMQKQADLMLARISEDSSGACWHTKEMTPYVLQEAYRLDSLKQEEKKALPFFGLSVGMKDLFCIKGLKTTAGSRILKDFTSPYDSTVWQTLKSKGVLLGAKLAMDEFAMGSFSDTSSFGRVSIPGLPEHTAGGSSGGSGAALAASLVDFTVGSDTGGSVRLPASFCSVVGYKPSYGAFSRYGMIAYASSLDQAGFLTSSLADMSYLVEQDIALPDPQDTTCRGLGVYQQSHSEIKKVGYFPDILEDSGLQSDVKTSYQKTLEMLTFAGIELVPVAIPYMKSAAEIYYIIACSEASSNLARYQGVYFGEKLITQDFKGSYWEQVAQYRSKYFGLEVQKRIMLGSFILSAENFSAMYEKAVQLRQALKKEFDEILSIVDTLVLPVSPMSAPKWSDIAKMTSAEIYMSDYMTVPFSLAGLPAFSLPWFKTKEGLGIGMQFVGRQFHDYRLLSGLMALENQLFKG